MYMHGIKAMPHLLMHGREGCWPRERMVSRAGRRDGSRRGLKSTAMIFLRHGRCFGEELRPLRLLRFRAKEVMIWNSCTM